MDKLLSFKSNIVIYLVHPFMLAIYLWIGIWITTPEYFNKYNAEIVETKTYIETTKIYYHDLDGDTLTERLVVNYDKDEKVPEIVYFDEKDRIIGQWNLRGNWLASQQLFFGDYNKNGYDEVYCFTRVGDSIYLNCSELLIHNGFGFEDRFICTSNFFNVSQNDCRVLFGSMIDVNKDDLDEFVFMLRSGLSKQPRAGFAYYLNLDSIVSSQPSATCFSGNVDFYDINGDGVVELTGLVTSPGNIQDELPYPDTCAWLMVYDIANGFDFVFEPLEFDSLYSTAEPLFYKTSEKIMIACIYSSIAQGKTSNKYWLQLYDSLGNLLKESSISKEKYENIKFIKVDFPDGENLYIIDRSGTVLVTDTSLQLKLHSSVDIENLTINPWFFWENDIDEDDDNEIVYKANINSDEKLLIFRSNLKEYTIVDLPGAKFTKQWVINKRITEDGTLLMLQADDLVFYVKYTESNYYLLKYPVYLLSYLLLFLLFSGLQKVQNILANRKFESEKQLMRQQMALSKKQLEPHFMLNTLNSIGYMFSKESKEDAQYYFGRFASLIHRGLKYADQTETTLFEELEFVKDYLILQQKRFSNDFEFVIEADDNLDLNQILIPHSLIYTFAENVLKHGLQPKIGVKELTIRIADQKHQTKITITDNGVGRTKSKILKTSGTGKGLQIVKSIVESYNKINNRSISYQIVDVNDENGTGTIVEIIV